MFLKKNAEGDMYPYGFWERLKAPWDTFLFLIIFITALAVPMWFAYEVYDRFTAEQRARENANLAAFVDRYECLTVLVGRFPMGKFTVERTTTMRCAKLGPNSISYEEIFKRAQAEGKRAGD